MDQLCSITLRPIDSVNSKYFHKSHLLQLFIIDVVVLEDIPYENKDSVFYLKVGLTISSNQFDCASTFPFYYSPLIFLFDYSLH